MKSVWTKCRQCGDVLKRHPRARNPRQWCSEACRLRAYRAAHPKYVERQNQLAKTRRELEMSVVGEMVGE